MRWLLRRFRLSPNAYYNHRKKRRAKQQERKAAISACIKDIFHRYGGKMGYRMIHKRLAHEGYTCSLLTVHKYMKELGLRSIAYKRKPPYVKGKKHSVFPNLLNRNFVVAHTDQRWCTDFTYLHLANGQVRYNCSILDLSNRSIVATKTDSHITADLAIETLQEALQKHAPKKGLILHSDQGVQFTSKAFTEFCKQNGVIQSMSRAGCPYDNAPMESFFGKMKNEHLNHFVIRNTRHLKWLIEDYIFRYYHHIRPHSSLGGKTPMEVQAC